MVGLNTMEPAGTALAQLMRQRMCPVVMVMATPRAEETSRKNELGIVDLLRPFCVLDQIDGTVKLPRFWYNSSYHFPVCGGFFLQRGCFHENHV